MKMMYFMNARQDEWENSETERKRNMVDYL